jgi:hypothetical protein
MRSGGGSCTDPPFVSPGTPLLHWQQHSDPNESGKYAMRTVERTEVVTELRGVGTGEGG